MAIERNLIDFNNKLSSVFSMMSIFGTYKVIGSSRYKTIRYNSDFDLETHMNIKTRNVKNTIKSIYNHFKKIFIDCKRNPHLFITDFKCGVDKVGEPLRWTYKDIMKGYKVIDGYNVSFEDAIKMKSTIKLDIIYLLNGIFNEISDNYYIKIDDITNYSEITKDSILKSIHADYEQQIKDGQYYKALKRKFATDNINGKDTSQLLQYFNSDIGLLNKTKADLDMLLILLEQTFRKVKIEDIHNNLQIIKQSASYSSELNLSKAIENICKLQSHKKMYNSIKKIKERILNFINNHAEQYINNNII